MEMRRMIRPAQDKSSQLNIAQVWPATRSLGPGLRAAVWVQGCHLRCPGCISPEWIPQRPAHSVAPDELAEQLLQNTAIEGFTFSGGEPMLQAMGLAALVRFARQKRTINVICFTGYYYQQLVHYPAGSGVPELLAEVDVLIDGPYLAALNDGQGMRGSSNQTIHYLTDRLRGYNFGQGPRRVEIHIQGDYALMVGVPPLGLPETLEQVMEKQSAKLLS